MAYAASGLRRMAYGGFLDTAGAAPVTYHSYVTNDTLAQIIAANYFDSAYQRLSVGDIVWAHVDMDGTPDVTMLRVTVSSSAGVTVVQESAGYEVSGVAGGYKVARGQHTTVDENDTVVTGLTTVVAVVASLDSDPVDGAMYVTASIGDQAGAPAAGSVLIKTWKNTDADATHVAATTFSMKVNWIAIGT